MSSYERPRPNVQLSCGRFPKPLRAAASVRTDVAPQSATGSSSPAIRRQHLHSAAKQSRRRRLWRAALAPPPAVFRRGATARWPAGRHPPLHEAAQRRPPARNLFRRVGCACRRPRHGRPDQKPGPSTAAAAAASAGLAPAPGRRATSQEVGVGAHGECAAIAAAATGTGRCDPATSSICVQRSASASSSQASPSSSAPFASRSALTAGGCSANLRQAPKMVPAGPGSAPAGQSCHASRKPASSSARPASRMLSAGHFSASRLRQAPAQLACARARPSRAPKAAPARKAASASCMAQSAVSAQAGTVGGAAGLAVTGSRRIIVWRVNRACAFGDDFHRKTHSSSEHQNE